MNEPPKTSIGAYALTRSLPGPGEVYQARSAAGDRVLIQRFGQTLTDDGLEVARRDVGICARLDHPAIVRATDLFEDEGKLVLVFDYIEGTKLSQIIKKPLARSKLQAQAIWEIGFQLVGALAQAHAAADTSGEPAPLCHGHLSPAQIIITATGEVKIEGFGLAALVGTEAVPRAPGYQAPEEMKGGRITPRGDLYAAAAVLWTLLGGTEPPAAAGAKLPIDPIRDRTPPQLLQALDRALEPILTRRKITAAELEPVMTELREAEQSVEALADVARAVAQSGRTLAGTGSAMLGMLVRGKGAAAAAAGGAAGQAPAEQGAARPAAAGPAAAASKPEPAAPAVPAPAEPQVAAASPAKAAAAPAKAAKGRLRQATLLGTWPQSPTEKTKAASGPRQAVARTADESADDADLGMAVVRPEPAAPGPKPEPAAPAPKLAARPLSRKPPPVVEPGPTAKPAPAKPTASKPEGKATPAPTAKPATPRPPVAADKEPALGRVDKSPRPASVRPTPKPTGLAGLDQTIALPDLAADADSALGEGALPRPRLTPAPPKPAAPVAPPPPAEILDAESADEEEEDALEQAMLGATVAIPREDVEPPPPIAAPAPLVPPSLEPPTAPTVPGRGAPPGLRRASAPSPGGLKAEALFDGLAHEGDAPVAAAAAPSPPAPGALEAAAPVVPAAAPAAVLAAVAPVAAASPWSPPASEIRAPSADKPLSLGKAALIALLTAIVVMVAGVWWTRRQVSLTNVAPVGPPSATVSARASASSSERPVASAALPSGSASASASSAPSAEPSGTSSTAATAAPSAASDDDPRDGKSLPQNRGLVRVSFEAPPDAQVFMMGKPIGPVGKKIEAACGRTWLRVGQPPAEGKDSPPTWLSKGQSVYVQCRMVTDVTLPPGP